jgi:hypothetical protein
LWLTIRHLCLLRRLHSVDNVRDIYVCDRRESFGHVLVSSNINRRHRLHALKGGEERRGRHYNGIADEERRAGTSAAASAKELESWTVERRAVEAFDEDQLTTLSEFRALQPNHNLSLLRCRCALDPLREWYPAVPTALAGAVKDPPRPQPNGADMAAG